MILGANDLVPARSLLSRHPSLDVLPVSCQRPHQEVGRPRFVLAALAESVSCLTCSSVKRFSPELAVCPVLVGSGFWLLPEADPPLPVRSVVLVPDDISKAIPVMNLSDSHIPTGLRDSFADLYGGEVLYNEELALI